MNKSAIAFAFVAALGAISSAGASETFPLQSFDNVGTAPSRAQVQSEARAAQAAGLIAYGQRAAGSPKDMRFMRDRAEVRNEARSASKVNRTSPYLQA
jgi:Domain of unknown function (DUF4148)